MPLIVSARRSSHYHPGVDASRPIGVFDSGVGGLTVLHECLVTLPHEDFVYVGDTGRFPYGQHSLDELRAFSRRDHELARGAGRQARRRRVQLRDGCGAADPAAPLRACRSSAWSRRRRARPCRRRARAASACSRRFRRSRAAATREAIGDLDAGVEVIQVACPGLADRIQDGDPYDEAMVEHVREVCAPLRAAERRHRDPRLHALPADPPDAAARARTPRHARAAAEELAGEVAETLRRKGLARDDSRRGDYRFACTGDPDAFARIGQRFLQLPLGPVRRLAFSELAAV